MLARAVNGAELNNRSDDMPPRGAHDRDARMRMPGNGCRGRRIVRGRMSRAQLPRAVHRRNAATSAAIAAVAAACMRL